MYALFLFQQSPHCAPVDENRLISLLKEIEFLQSDETRLIAAARLMQLITFAGCSPVINDEFHSTQICIHTAPITFAMGGEGIQKIHCGECKKPITQPEKLIAAYPEQQQFNCENCQRQIPITEINWRRSVGFSNCFIEISNIFPKEAMPGDFLLDQLQAFSGHPWGYFYSKLSTPI